MKDKKKEKKKYKCIYDGSFDKTIRVIKNNSDECMFEITPVFKRLKLVYTIADKEELSILKAKAEEYLKELIKNHLL